MTLISVDFPLPFGPKITACSPASIENVMPRNAMVFSRWTETFSNSISLGILIHIYMIHILKVDRITIVTIDRPEARNAVNRETADALVDAFQKFDADDSSH